MFTDSLTFIATTKRPISGATMYNILEGQVWWDLLKSMGLTTGDYMDLYEQKVGFLKKKTKD